VRLAEEAGVKNSRLLTPERGVNIINTLIGNHGTQFLASLKASL